MELREITRDFHILKCCYSHGCYFGLGTAGCPVTSGLAKSAGCKQCIEVEGPKILHKSCQTHCCIRHGCKYGYTDCQVTSGEIKQTYSCEYCGDEDEEKDVAAFKVEKEVITTVTISMDGEKAQALIDWLNWSFKVWGKIKEYESLNDEIFHPDEIPAIPNVDPMINLRNALREEKP